jgi:hypothetical protein
VPFLFALLIAHAVARLPKAPITVSNVLGSNQDTPIDIEPARIDFGFDPIGLDSGLRLALDAYGPKQSRRVERPLADEGDQRLARDCRLIVRYLIGCEPTNELIERYCAAMQMKFLKSRCR